MSSQASWEKVLVRGEDTGAKWQIGEQLSQNVCLFLLYWCVFVCMFGVCVFKCELISVNCGIGVFLCSYMIMFIHIRMCICT